MELSIELVGQIFCLFFNGGMWCCSHSSENYQEGRMPAAVQIRGVSVFSMSSFQWLFVKYYSG